MSRRCILCRSDKPEADFYRYAYTTNQGNASMRHDSRCISCARARRREQGADPEQSREWRAKNAARVRQYAQEYRASAHGKAVRRGLVIKRQLGQAARTPAWADITKIAEIYAQADSLTAQTGVKHEVDHAVPLQGKAVSGLHVHYNLQVLRYDLNRAKHNTFSGVVSCG